MNTIAKLALSITVLTFCFAGIYFLQQHDSIPAAYPAGVFYETPNVPVYKGRTTPLKKQGSSAAMPTLPMSSSSSLFENNSSKSARVDQSKDVPNVNVIAPSVAATTTNRKAAAGTTATVTGYEYGFYAYSGRSAESNGVSAANNNLSNRLSKPAGGSINTLGDDGLIDPDNGDDDLPPPPLPVTDGLGVMIMMALIYWGRKGRV